MEYGAPIPPPYDDPANWPYRWATYEQARGFVTRIRAEGSHEGKLIAKECGVSWPTLKRAVRWYLISTQQYEPDQWLAYQRQRKAEARRQFLDLMTQRHLKMKDERKQIEQGRGALAAHHTTLDQADRDVHIARPRDTSERRRELQRKLHAKNRPRAAL
jgi:hypothetical protein